MCFHAYSLQYQVLQRLSQLLMNPCTDVSCLPRDTLCEMRLSSQQWKLITIIVRSDNFCIILVALSGTKASCCCTLIYCVVPVVEFSNFRKMSRKESNKERDTTICWVLWTLWCLKVLYDCYHLPWSSTYLTTI